MVIVEVISTNWQDDYYNKLRDYRDICLPCHDPNYGETIGIKSYPL
ncbi:MAG: Uma2 family endonuclease [Rhizonema sp. PD38]|nr:Uma2 family endonuclease [Rhizonema sp. PD38]